jgi:phosphomannomutase/phosphoglucomutase
MPEPTPAGLAPLSARVVESDAAFGVAHDGDADRAVFVDDRGRFVEENREFALIARHVCRRRTGVIVTPVSTSQLIEDVAAATGCTVRYTRVGSIYVARTMLGLVAAGIPVAFGGEGNGGLIYPDHQYCRDGGMTAAMMVGLLAEERRPLSALLDELPPYHFISERVRTGRADEVIAAVEAAFPDFAADRTDGVRISKGRTWALVRRSGTEPIVRVMVEAPDRAAAEAMRDEVLERIAPFVD